MIGAVDFNPSKWRVNESIWHMLESVCVVEGDGDSDEFEPAILHMGQSTDNSRRPLCPLKGNNENGLVCYYSTSLPSSVCVCVFITEPVAVTFSVRNPLSVPLLMTNATAVWEYIPPTEEVSVLGVVLPVP